VKGEQRKTVDVGLVVQAVIALGRQLRDEAQDSATSDERETSSKLEASSQESQS
jgi:hypothetical protein